MKAVKEIWVRSALAMGADDRRLFAKVILPGALPYILTGLRLGLAQAWRILVGVEMLAAVPWGLGWMIFGAREFLNTDVMLAGVAVIGVDRPGAGEARVPAPGALHGRALGDDDMSGTADRGRSARRAAISLLLAAAAYEALARSGVFPAALLPTLPAVGRALAEGVLDGSLPGHAASTLYRVLFGMSLAVLIGVPLGILMGRFRPRRRLLPAAGERADADPVAGLGAGIHPVVRPRQRHRHRHRLLRRPVPLLLNAWTGVRAVNPLWLRAGQGHGRRRALPVLEGDPPRRLPFLITGLRQAFLRAWIAVVGAEMLAASDWGLGWVIFDAKEFLQRRRHARLARRHRPHRLSLRAPGVRLAGARDGAEVGHGAGAQGLSRPCPTSTSATSRSSTTRLPGGSRAWKRASFDIEQAEFLCLVGPSGCGKSTLLNIIAGFLAPTAGEVLIGGKPITGHGMDRGVVFQDFAQLFPWRTALGNVAFGLEMKGMPRPERERIALEQLRLVKLEKFAQAYPHHLSGGMQQRVAIARALAYDPSVLLMDEPFAALDALTRDDMQRLLSEVWRATRKTVVYVTHNVAEAVYLADRVVVMTPHPGTVKAQVAIRPRPARATLSAWNFSSIRRSCCASSATGPVGWVSAVTAVDVALDADPREPNIGAMRKRLAVRPR